MPTYVYRREDGTVFDAFQRISDPPLTEDPETGLPVVRVISGGAGLQFKGSGFYLTDYARKDSKSESSDRKSQASGSAAPEPKADAKPAPKADAPATPATPATSAPKKD
jgi:predicted nucleic acid-binding Zn ribbon protein